MDIRCSICGEPYEAAHIDMLPWEAKLFNQGAGCPCCEGVKPDGVDADEAYTESLHDRLLNGLDDYHQQDLIMITNGDYPPKWERPSDKLLWECGHCHTKVYENIDDHDHYAKGCNACELERQNSNSYWRGTQYVWDPVRIDPALERDGYKYCECCVKSCDHCGEQYVEDDDCTYSLPDGSYHFKDACSEECLSALENEQFDEAWSSYGASELRKEWCKLFLHGYASESLLDDVSDDELREWWFDHAGDKYIVESSGVCIPINDYAGKVTRDDLAQLLWSARKRRREQSSSTTGASS